MQQPYQTLKRILCGVFVVAMLLPSSLFAQVDLSIESADGGDQKESSEPKPVLRLKWFLGQRGVLTPNIDGSQQDYYRLIREEMAKEGYSMGLDSDYEINTTPGTLNWSSIGPVGLDAQTGMAGSQWGTTSGRIRAMAIHPSDANTVYVGAAAGGIWKTTNGGASWSDIASSLASLTYGAIAIDPNNTNTVYAGGGEIMYSSNPWIYEGHGLFKSTDAGSTWTNITNGFGTATHFGAIAVSPHNSNYVFAALGSGNFIKGTSLSNEGVWRSTDAGNTWSRVVSYSDAMEVWVHPDSAGYIYAAIGGGHSNTGIYRSTNNGSTWSRTSVGLPSGGGVDRIQATQSPSNPETIFSIIYNGSTTTLWKTTDGGAGWFQVSNGVQLGGNYGGGWRDQGWYDLCVAVHPTNPSIVMTGNVELHRSTNGADMSVLRTGPGTGAWYSPCHVDYHIIRFSSSTPNTVYLGCDDGVFKSTDGGATWFDVNNGLATLQFYRIASHPTDINTIIGGAQDNGNYRTTNGGSGNWEGVTTGDGMSCAFDPANPNIVYMSTQYGNHMKSTNGGSSFFGMAYTGGAWLSPIVIHPTDNNTLFVVNTSVYKSTDKGSSFSTLATGVTLDDINTMSVSPVNPANMIVAGSNAFNKNPEIRVSSDSGATWTSINGNIGGNSLYVSRVVCHPTSANTMYVVRSGFEASNKIYKSTDLGSTWTNITGNLPNVPCNDLIVDPQNATEYYVANDFGVYHTTDDGTTWTRESSGMPFVPVMDFDLVQIGSNRWLRAGTHGRSAYQASIDGGCVSSPSITTHPANQTDCEGATVVFVSGATGNPSPSVQWEYSTNSGGSWADVTGGTSATLSFTAAASQNGYQYRAAYTNNCGSATSNTATLTVQTAPSVTTPLAATTSVCEGNSAVLIASVSGSPVPSYQWQLSTNSGGNWSDIIGETGSTLTLTSVQTSMDGNQYRYRADNTCGSVFASATTLDVQTSPVVATHPLDLAVATNGTANFSATATGNPSPSVQWEVSTNSGGTWSPLSGETSTVLSFTATLAMNGNQYRAVFTNTCGNATSNAATLSVGSFVDIAATMTVSNSSPTTGSTVTYTVSLVNNGTLAASSVSLTDNLPSDLTFVSCNSVSGVPATCSGSGNKRVITFGTFAPAATATVTILASVNCDVADGTNIANTVTATTTPADANSGDNTDSQTITADNPPPVLTLPADVTENTLSTATTCSRVLANVGTATATDNCSGVVIAVSGVPAGDEYPVGTTTLTWTATDAGGEVVTGTQDVTIIDATDPVADVTNLPDLTAQCSYTISTAPTATDNCDGSLNGDAGQSLPITFNTQGTHIVTWTYTDSEGNTSSQNQNVIIDDTTPPVADITTLPTLNGDCGFAITVAPTATDNCNGTIDGDAGQSLPIVFSAMGTYTLTWTYTDSEGNTSSQQQTVIIDDTTPPVPVVNPLPAITGECSAAVTTIPTATDNCVAGTITATTTDPVAYTQQGTYTITWTYDDGNGNTSTQTQTVIVDDVTPPVVMCPAPVNVEADANDQAPVPNFTTGASATDNCTPSGGIILAQSPAEGTTVGLGVTSVTVSGTDEAANTGTCNTSVNVVERTKIGPSVSDASISFGCGSLLTFTRSYTIDNNGGNYGGGLLQWQASATSQAISFNASSGYEGDDCSFTVDPRYLSTGNTTLYITITAWNSVTNTPAANSPFTFPVIISKEPATASSYTQTQNIGSSWTAFTNSYNQKFGEAKSNNGTISFTMKAFPCSLPRSYQRVNMVRRYFNLSSTASSVNVDVRFYFTDTEMKPKIVYPSQVTMRQQPLYNGAWTDKGGTPTIPGNYVTLTGLTNIVGNWMPAHPYAQWWPKPLALHITSATYDHSSRRVSLEWNTNVRNNNEGFYVERAYGYDADVNEWQIVGLLGFNERGEYQFTEPVADLGRYHYRISTITNEGTLLESSIITLEAADTPEQFWLGQNYPNPFNPETSISYHVPVESEVELTVYDMYWREVESLASGIKKPGTHEVRFNAAGLSSGTYFYQLRAGSFVQTRKMNLLK